MPYSPATKLFFSVLGVAFAAFCVWLVVRIVNRRERWAKWTLVAAAVGLLVLYVASLGPACWWLSEPTDMAWLSGMTIRQAPLA